MKLKNPFFLRIVFLAWIPIFQTDTWAKINEWDLYVQRNHRSTSSYTSAQIRSTKENLLLISTVSPDLSLGHNIAFSQCHYPVDLKPFTQSLFAYAVGQLKLKQDSDDLTTPKIRINPQYQEDFGYHLAYALTQSGYDTLVIQDPSETSDCINTENDALLAIAATKLDPRKIILMKRGSHQRVSLADWSWQIVWSTLQADSIKSAAQLFELLGHQLQALLPNERSLLKQDSCQSDSPRSEPYP